MVLVAHNITPTKYITYSGADNILTLETINQASFICSFNNIKFYPFETQKCSFKIFLPGINNHITRLIPGNLTNVGPKSVGEYQVKQWTVKAGPVILSADDKKHFNFADYNIESSVGLTFTAHLSRKR